MNNIGYIRGDGYAFTYQIGETPIGSSAGILDKEEDQARPLTARSIDKYYIWPAGANNLEPNICKTLIKGNRLLPSLIEKQVSILYGNGPQLYISEVKADGTLSRRYIKNDKIQSWLDNWRECGLPDTYEGYLNKCIRSFYYSEGIFSKWHLSRALAAGMKGFLPVVGLEHIDELRCRMATTKNLATRTDVEDSDFPLVMVGNWESSFTSSEFKIYNRLDYTKPLAKNSAVSYSKNPNHGEDIYATNVFFTGIKEWIKGCNATPEYINSFLENSLSARHHVIIPNAWLNQKERELKELCDINAKKAAEGKQESDYIKVKIGAKTIEVGTIYNSGLLEQVVQAELTQLTNFLAGRGKNQGKVYATRSLLGDNGDVETWKIEEITQKYKEYIEALITYDKRADMVLLSSKGIDSSISNVSSDGVISKSGSDVYYNYLVYLTQQALPESIICADINYAIRLNFPEEYKAGIRLGFYRPTVQRQEDVSPQNRMSNQQE
ncbi:MAG: hypothetical protein ACI3ZQ_04970 [Candidatus Cryptobacteroides sp.]